MAMTAEQFRDAIEALGIKQSGDEGVGAFLGVNERTPRRWADGTAPIPDSVAMLLRLMIARRLRPQRVRDCYAEG